MKTNFPIYPINLIHTLRVTANSAINIDKFYLVAEIRLHILLRHGVGEQGFVLVLRGEAGF